MFGIGSGIVLPPRLYLVDFGGGVFCLGIQQSAGKDIIFGTMIMRKYYVVFDQRANRVGFANLAAGGCSDPGEAPVGNGPSNGRYPDTNGGSGGGGGSSPVVWIIVGVVVAVLAVVGAFFSWKHSQRKKTGVPPLAEDNGYIGLQ